MGCIERRPRCQAADTPAVPTPITEIVTIVGLIIGVIGLAGAVLKAVGQLSVDSAGHLHIAKIEIAGAAGSGALVAAGTAIAVLFLINQYARDRCTQGQGIAECVAGAVNEVVNSFATTLDELLPFTATHDRVDVIAKSRFWDVIEDGQAFVYCTGEEPPRRSEIMRCYYFNKRVCMAAKGAMVGGIAGAVAGVVAGAAIAAAIGCATIFLCIIALIVAAIVAAVAVLVGALVGGQIAKATTDDRPPTAAGGAAITAGDYVTVHGNLRRREEDGSANVLWWTSQTDLHGRVSDALPRPLSYCEIDEELAEDGCRRAERIR